MSGAPAAGHRREAGAGDGEQLPAVSVVVVSDYAAPGEKRWDDELRIVKALAGQDYTGEFEVLLVEHEGNAGSAPGELARTFPGLRIVAGTGRRSSELKDEGTRAASHELVAIFEADCPPNRGWLRLTVAAMRESGASVVSGRTLYGRRTMRDRVCSLIDRGFLERRGGTAGRVRNYSNNGALWRREVALAFPYPEAASPFVSSRYRLGALTDAGHRLYMEPRAVVQHAFPGVGFVLDLRRSEGFADMITETARLSYGAIPRLMARRAWRDLLVFRRAGPQFLRWYDWPAAIAMALALPLLMAPGMVDAVRGRELPAHTGYR